MAAGGKFLERQVDDLVKYTINSGFFAHKLKPNRTHNGVYIKGQGEPFDFIFLLRDCCLAFDAKETVTDKYNIRDKDIKQLNNLKKAKNAGADAFLLILFPEQHLCQIDVDEVIEILESGRRTIHYENCEISNIDRRVRESCETK